jgi:DUF1680 family protein
MRTLAGLEGYLATHDDGGGIQLHQYAPGTVTTGEVTLTVETEYPWDGLVRVRVDSAPGPVRLSLRVPAWAEGATIDGAPAAPGYVQAEVAAGEAVELRLPMEVRTTTAHPRVDAVRGCVALERGPLVYAVEQADHDIPVDDLRIDPDAPRASEHRPDLLGGVTVVTAGELTLVPYYAWANRGPAPMRVWIPTI